LRVVGKKNGRQIIFSSLSVNFVVENVYPTSFGESCVRKIRFKLDRHLPLLLRKLFLPIFQDRIFVVLLIDLQVILRGIKFSADHQAAIALEIFFKVLNIKM
jgi:hypothetical protein